MAEETISIPKVANSKGDAIEGQTSDDLFNALPDDILGHIISSLPFGCAVRASLLSTRWRGLWKKALQTTQKDGSVEEICGEICYLLDDAHQLGLSTRRYEFESELDLLKNCRRLRFNFGQGSFLIATIVPTEALHLDFHTERDESPSEIGGHLKTDNRWSTSVFTHPSLTSVSPSNMIRTLHLISVTNLTSKAVSSIIPKFQSLENLIIKGCPGLHFLHIDASDRFSHLMIFNCLHLKYLCINACKLDKFRFRGLFPKFVCASSLCLKDAMLDFEGGQASDPSSYSRLVPAIRTVKILTLRRWTFEEHMPIKMFGYQEINLHTRFYFPFNNLDYLEELWWIDNSMDKHNIIVLLSFLKMCPSLENLFISIDPTSYSGRSTSRRLCEVPQHTRLNHLKFIKLEGVMKDEDKISLAENLLEVVTTEPLVIAKSHDNHLSKLVKVDLQENKFLYKFVKVEEGYSGEICSRHAHMDL